MYGDVKWLAVNLFRELMRPFYAETSGLSKRFSLTVIRDDTSAVGWITLMMNWSRN